MSVGLRAVHPLDHDVLRAIELEPANAQRWRYLGSTPSPDDHQRQLWAGVLEQRVITVDDRAAGLVVAYNYLPRSAVAWFAAVTSGRYHRTGTAVVASAAFLSELWGRWPLRKVYLSVPAPNLDQFRSLVRRCSVEATLAAHLIVERTPVDVVVLSMSRKQWASSGLPSVARRAAAPSPPGGRR